MKNAFCLLVLGLLAGAALAAGRSNVLLIVSDDLRDTVGRYGETTVKTQLSQPTPAGRKGHMRNLTAGKLNWCSVGAMEGTDHDQPDGQTALQAIAAIEKDTATGKPWFVGAGFHRPHDPLLVPKK